MFYSEYVQKTRANIRTAAEIAERLKSLVKLLNETVNIVKAEIERLQRSVDGDERARLNPEQFNRPSQFNAIIEDLKWWVDWFS